MHSSLTQCVMGKGPQAPTLVYVLSCMWAWSLIFAFDYNKAVLVGMGCIISQVQEGSTTVHLISVGVVRWQVSLGSVGRQGSLLRNACSYAIHLWATVNCTCHCICQQLQGVRLWC
jgi:hypothetical protein